VKRVVLDRVMDIAVIMVLSLHWPIIRCSTEVSCSIISDRWRWV